MLLKTLKLSNIRSYVSETLQFPNGIVLLAGDIGAGKSTILLAIEFVLFGLMRGELSGSSLLRHGAKEGSVELTFVLNNSELTIKRTLKRTKDSVEQNAGWIIKNGLKKDMTPTELKSFVLDILGYPKELLTKSKSLIYRYTVYTPQEDMKRILFEDTETRLNILRKVFNIDKYKKIKENAGTYAKSLREKKRVIEATVSDEQQKKQELEEFEKQLAENKQKMSVIQPELDNAKKIVEEQRKRVEEFETKQKAFSTKQQELAACSAEVTAILSQQTQLQKEQEQLQSLKEPEKAESPDLILQTIARQDEEIRLIQQNMSQHNTKVGELDGQRKHCENLIDSIGKLDNCPTCLQNVEDSHKETITSAEKEKLNEISKQILDKKEKLTEFEQRQSKTQSEITSLRQKHVQIIQANEKQKQFEQQRQRISQIQTQILQSTEKIKVLEEKRQELKTALQGVEELEQQIKTAKSQFETALQREKQVIVQHTQLTEQEKHTLLLIERLRKELTERQKARQELERLNKYNTWIADFFVPLMDNMEKHVMAQVKYEFDDLFQRWLEVLIEGEVLTAKLDNSFTPLIQQNGYDVEYPSLSGGEKTACALAYRLALNKVINDLIDTIHTRDVLILDEPTDGFSSDQLDKMSDVLEQLNCKQIILVSHEAKIESMVDKILRVDKDEHISRIS